MVYDPKTPTEFRGNKTITHVTIQQDATTIGAGAFDGCSSLASVVFTGGALQTIGEDAFFECTGLTEISFPEGLTSIGRAAFLRCRRSPR